MRGGGEVDRETPRGCEHDHTQTQACRAFTQPPPSTSSTSSVQGSVPALIALAVESEARKHEVSPQKEELLGLLTPAAHPHTHTQDKWPPDTPSSWSSLRARRPPARSLTSPLSTRPWMVRRATATACSPPSFPSSYPFPCAAVDLVCV